MKKKKYRFLCLILSCVFVFGCGSHALAATSGLANKSDSVSQTLVEVWDMVFSGNGEIYNENGDDITANFIAEYQLLYDDSNFSLLSEACDIENVSTIHTRHFPDTPSTRTIFEYSYNERVTHRVKQEGSPFPGKTWYLVVIASGSYRYQDSYGGYIIDFPGPTISFEFVDTGDAFSPSLDSNQVTSPSYSADKRSVTFTVTTTHHLDYFFSDSGGAVFGEMGPYETKAVFTIGPN